MKNFKPYEHTAPDGSIVKLIPIDAYVSDIAKSIASWELKNGAKVYSSYMFDGGGMRYKDFLIETIQNVTNRVYDRAFEWCAGFGVLGFECLEQKICKHIVFSDYHPLAINNCLLTAKVNNVEDYVTGYVSPTIIELPDGEMWDLVISNPPHSPNFEAIAQSIIDDGQPINNIPNSTRLIVDTDWSIHEEFMKNITKHLNFNADIFLIENDKYDFLIDLAKTVDLTYVDTYKYPEHSEGYPHVIMHFKF